MAEVTKFISLGAGKGSIRQAIVQLVNNLLPSPKDLQNVVVTVGYTASYALFVHENVEMKLKGKPRPRGRGLYWDPQGRAQPKFLESVAREEGIVPGVHKVWLEPHPDKAWKGYLLAIGLAIQRESQKRVPVDTGHLKNSAFTKMEER